MLDLFLVEVKLVSVVRMVKVRCWCSMIVVCVCDVGGRGGVG